jgi:hypothetical protein
LENSDDETERRPIHRRTPESNQKKLKTKVSDSKLSENRSRPTSYKKVKDQCEKDFPD